MTTEGDWVLPWPDDRFWVRLKGGWTPDPEIRWRIDSNAHTHRGHFHVCAIGHDLHRSVNMADVAEISPDARLWIAGFLHGQEAGLLEFLGDSYDLYQTMSEDDVQQWASWNDRFRRRGWAQPLNSLPPATALLNELSDPPAWTYIAGRYWVVSGGGWAIAEPQPPLDDGEPGSFWPGTVCASRKHCALKEMGLVLVCEDCHEVTALADDG